MVSFDAQLLKYNSKLWGHHFIVPKEIAEQFKLNQVTRVVCTIESCAQFHCAIMPAGDDVYFINVNKENRKKCKWRIGETRHVSIQKDKSKYGMEMPEELAEVLKADPEGDRVFHELTPGKQRNLIYIAGQPKRVDTRIKKSIIIIDYLKEVDGQLDFKQLNLAFKERKNDF